MTRMHYIKAAEMINQKWRLVVKPSTKKFEELLKLETFMVNFFSSDNPRFKPTTFRDACRKDIDFVGLKISKNLRALLDNDVLYI